MKWPELTKKGKAKWKLKGRDMENQAIAMAEEQKVYLIGLTKVANLGPKTCRNLIAYCGGIEEVFRTPISKLMRIPGIGCKKARTLTAARTVEAAEMEMRFAERHRIQVLSYVDHGYPTVLKASEDAPLILYKRGELDLNRMPSIAIVGTRQPSERGRAWARKFASFFARAGFNVVSGLAYGIDSEAHDAALQAGGITTGVLAHGLDRIYPSEHASKALRIVENGGALLTEFPSGVGPEAYNFPARNRIISGLCHATLVVEAKEKGGAQITARFAFEQNREVYAMPGPLDAVTSVGCNRLIRDQVAKLVTCPEEILEDLGHILKVQAPTPQAPTPQASTPQASTPQASSPKPKPNAVLSHRERSVIGVLGKGNAEMAAIKEKTGFGTSELTHLILALEFKGLVQQVPGRKYALV